MNISNLSILKQSNGKYALWNCKEQWFEMHNQDSAEKIREHILMQVANRLSMNITDDAQDDQMFKLAVQEYKLKHGIDTEPIDTAKAILAEMGE